jgi:acetyl esterase
MKMKFVDLKADLKGLVLQVLLPLRMKVPERLQFRDVPARTEDVWVPTRHDTVRVTVYAPPSASASYAGSDPAGVYVNLHGGGWVMRHPERDDAICRYVAHHAGVWVLNVDYDVAPQRRYPVPVEQTVDVLGWVADQAEARGWDIDRIGIGGQSSGSHIAFGAVRRAQVGDGVTPAAYVSLYGPFDMTLSGDDRPGNDSDAMLAGGVLDTFTQVYLPDPATRTDPIVSPAHAANAAAEAPLPPTLVITAERDVLRTEELRFVKIAREAGTDVVHWDAGGEDHSFPLSGSYEQAVAALEQVAAHLRKHLSSPATG